MLGGDQRPPATALHDTDVDLRPRRHHHNHPTAHLPVIRDLVTDVSFNYQKAREIPAFAPPKDLQPGEYRMAQEDVERSQEFRKCIECFLCQNVCHVVRDHEENKEELRPPAFPHARRGTGYAPTGHPGPQGHGSGRVRPRLLQHHQMLHRGVPRTHQDHRQRPHSHMKERVVDRKYDPIVWLGDKLFRRK